MRNPKTLPKKALYAMNIPSRDEWKTNKLEAASLDIAYGYTDHDPMRTISFPDTQAPSRLFR